MVNISKFPKKINKFYEDLKSSNFEKIFIKFLYKNTEIVELYPLTHDSINNVNIERLKKWRQKNKKNFSSKNNITQKSTKKFLLNYLDSKELRLLFLISYKKFYIGHLETKNLNLKENSIELTYILRGEKKYKGKMSEALKCITILLIEKYNIRKVLIKVEKENLKAINFYKANNFIFHKIEYNNIMVFKYNRVLLQKNLYISLNKI